MKEEAQEPWLNWMSLATVIMAVCATMSTFKGGSYSTQSVINQALEMRRDDAKAMESDLAWPSCFCKWPYCSIPFPA